MVGRYVWCVRAYRFIISACRARRAALQGMHAARTYLSWQQVVVVFLGHPLRAVALLSRVAG